MTPQDSKPQVGWIVIPKGFTGNKLALTLQAVPAPGFAWEDIDWPGYVNSLKSLTLHFRTGPAGGAKIKGSATARPLVRAGDIDLWRKIFQPDDKFHLQSTLAAPSTFEPAPTCRQAVALDGFAAAAQSALKTTARLNAARLRAAAPSSLLLRRPLRPPAAAIAAAPQSIDDVYHNIARLFHRSDLPLAGIPSTSGEPVAAGDPAMPHWQRKALQANPLGVDSTHLDYLNGLVVDEAKKAEQETLRRPIGHLNKEADRLAHMNPKAVHEFLLQNSPQAETNQATQDTPHAHTDTVLASLGHAFPLQERLGLISDWDIALQQTDLEGEISVKLEFAHDDGAASPVEHTWLWTTIKNGWPSEVLTDPTTGTPPLSFLNSGWIKPASALVTTCELRGNMMRVVARIQAVSDRNQVSVKGANPSAPATADMPSLRTGPFVMFVDGLAKWRSEVLTPDAGGQADPPAFTMADLTIGVRPDLRVSSRAEWLELMGREISYGIVGTPLAPEPDHHGRTAGYAPLPQFAGEDAAQTHDELFSWSGWNPAVPFPSAQTKRNKTLFCEHIRAIPGTNPRFRYGDTVAVRLRAVLRDGSSVTTKKAGHPDGSSATAQEDPNAASAAQEDLNLVGKGVATSLLGNRLLRYEPIAAPELMLASAEFPHGWTPLPPSANHVVLSSDPTHTIGCVRSDVRWILPGRLPNVVELDKHGCFDGGLTPRVGAFENCDIRRGTLNGSEQAVFVPKRGAAKDEVPYHPDPLAERIAVALVRVNSGGDWVPVTDGDGRPLRIEHALYHPGAKWPDARALHVTFLASSGGEPLTYSHHHNSEHDNSHHHADCRLIVRVPPGESFCLVAYALGDDQALTMMHAFGSFADDQHNLLVPMLASPLRIEVSHFVTTPDRPQLVQAKPTAHREIGASEVVVALDANASPAGTGSIDVQVRWEDPLDEPSSGAPRVPSGPLQQSQYAQVSLVANLDKELHTAIDHAVGNGQNKWAREHVSVGQNEEFRHSFPDGRHRMVEYFAVVRSRALMPETESAVARARAALPVARDSGIWRSLSEPIPVCILASHAPAAPVVRDILPAFSFNRVQSFNVTASQRMSGLSLIMERGWMNSGPGELLALLMPGVENSTSNGMVCGIGADPVLVPTVGLGKYPLISYFAPCAQRCDPSSRKVRGENDLPPPEGLLLYEPRYDAERHGWRVDIALNPDLALPLPFLRLVVARYQPNGDVQPTGGNDVRLSPAVAVDFIQLPAQRSALVIAHTDYPEHVTVKVSGPAVHCSGSVRLVIKALIEHDISTRPGSPLFVRASNYATLGLEREINGIATWSADVRSTVGPLHGRVRVKIVERAVEGRERIIEGPLYYFDTVEVAQLAPGSIDA